MLVEGEEGEEEGEGRGEEGEEEGEAKGGEEARQGEARRGEERRGEERRGEGNGGVSSKIKVNFRENFCFFLRNNESVSVALGRGVGEEGGERERKG